MLFFCEENMVGNTLKYLNMKQGNEESDYLLYEVYTFVCSLKNMNCVIDIISTSG